MKTPIKYLLLSCSILMLFSRCKKFVQISPPKMELVTADVFNSPASAISAETEIYTKMVNNAESYSMSFQNGELADEFTNFATDEMSLSMYQNAMNPSIGSYGCWQNAYNYIYQANAIIEGMQGNSNVSMPISNQIVGEAKFIRAFWYFYLTNEYRDVPLALSTEYSKNAILPKTAQADVYQQVVSDLTAAEAVLSGNYLDATDTASTADRVRPNKAVATALLAKVYLYTKKYDSAELLATQVINNPIYSLAQPLTITNYAFTSNSAEAIWQLATPIPAAFSGATRDGYNYTLLAAPSLVALSDKLVNSFETGDQRKAVWVGSFTTADSPYVTYYYPAKYKVNAGNGDPNNILEYVMVLRLAEQYLIRAEARAEQNNLAGAAGDVNVIRNRAGLSDLPDSIAASQPALLAAILHERQVELFTEWGNRWFDLIRTGSIDSVMGSPGYYCRFKGGTWNDNGKLYPIVLGDLLDDPNLKQNPGY